MSVIQSLLVQFGKLGDPILKYKYGYHTQNGLYSYFLAPWKLIVHKGAVFSVVCENKFLLSYLRNTSRKSILFRIGDMLHDVFLWHRSFPVLMVTASFMLKRGYGVFSIRDVGKGLYLRSTGVTTKVCTICFSWIIKITPTISSLNLLSKLLRKPFFF